MENKKIIFILFLVISLLVKHKVSAQVVEKSVELKTNKQIVEVGQNFTIYVNAKNFEVVACSLKIYFDETKVEVITKANNINVVNGSIIYSWFDEQGGKNAKKNEEIIQFEFKAKQQGIVNFTMQAEFYNQSQQIENITIYPVEIKIEEQHIRQTTSISEESDNINEINMPKNYEEINTNETSIPQNGKDINTNENNIQILENKNSISEINSQILEENKSNDKNNTNLAILRLNHEGISPKFEKAIKEYYIIIDEKINDLEVTAIPENKNSKVSITGNNNLQNGMNNIFIKVISENGQNEAEYKISVTRTNNKETANSNLENLAIENAILEPTFFENLTNYKVSVNNDVENINIFAIPQDEASTVKITGNNNLKQGNNIVTITVNAPNNITTKKYVINAYRKSKIETEEEIKSQQNSMQEKTQEIPVVDNSNQIEEKEQEKRENKRKSGLGILFGISVVIAITGIIAIIIVKKN